MALLPLMRHAVSSSSPTLRGAIKAGKVSPGGVAATAALLRLGGVRHGSITTWNHDWRPAPYPTTPEQRAAAAKKYGLLLEDYEPLPDDFGGFGDYPKLPDVGDYAKDPYYDYDNVDFRRDFGQPIHINYDCYHENGFEPQSLQKGYFPKGQTYKSMAIKFCVLYFGFLLFMELTSNIVADYPIMPKQYPSDVYCKGMKHYTFELVDECD